MTSAANPSALKLIIVQMSATPQGAHVGTQLSLGTGTAQMGTQALVGVQTFLYPPLSVFLSSSETDWAWS